MNKKEIKNRMESLPSVLHSLDKEIKIALVKKDYLALNSFPTDELGWERLRVNCGFSDGKLNLVKNRITPLQRHQPQGK